MTNQTSGKELVSAGHAFAKAVSMDTPLIVIAKMVSDLSTRLDCALARGNELQQKLDTVSEGLMSFAHHQRVIADKLSGDVQREHRIVASRIEGFAKQLCTGSHDIVHNTEDGAPEPLTALPVERDQYGYWSHPEYLAFCDGRENIPSAEFNQWMESKGMKWLVDYRDEEEIEPDVDGYDLSSWNPQAPAGDGWFVASIHDTEDGAVCIWLRATAPKGDSGE